jgi:hypothetical protein
MRISKIACGVLVAGLVSSSALAQDTAQATAQTSVQGAAATAPPPEAPVSKRVTVTTGVDFTSAYMFRGLLQHAGGTIAQPAVDFGIALGRGISANVGNWDSVHSTQATGNWYESDYYGSMTFTAGKLKPGVLFTSYTSPTDGFTTVHELAGVVAFDDSASKLPFAPKAILAFELGKDELGVGQADGGANKGIYLELGVRPSVKVAPKLTLAVPVKTGLSVKDYYEGPTGNNHFGYFDTGLQASVPLVSGKGGTLEAHGGVDFMWLGDNLKLLNNDDGFRPIGLLGFTFTY